MEQSKVLEVFKPYLDTAEYIEIFYSRLVGGYIGISASGDNVYEDFEDGEQIAEHILYNILMDIAFNAKAAVSRDGEVEVDDEAKAEYWRRVEPYISAMPELRDIAEAVIAAEDTED